MENRTIVVINDVCDDNGRGKQQSLCRTVLGQVPIFVGVRDDVEGAGEIIDQFSNLRGNPGLIIAQSAPRTAETNKTNGSSFCYFWIEDCLFITSVKGKMLSLVKKLGLVNFVHVIDSLEALKLVEIEDEVDSQFRSLEWLYYFAEFLLEKNYLPSKEFAIDSFPDMPNLVWHIDQWKDHEEWGNCKTTITENELVGFDSFEVKGRILKVYERLKNVPEGELAVVRLGSSGIKGRKFVEISVGNGNASKELGVKVGDLI